MLPKKLQRKLDHRKETDSLRELKAPTDLVDFSSNDYLGFSQNPNIYKRAEAILKDQNLCINGSTGSRLLSGNHALYETAEKFISEVHHTEETLLFNSGYDANVGFFASVPQRGDIILYDELIHASIRDGIQMSLAKAYKFGHNYVEAVAQKLNGLRQAQPDNEIYVVTESVFSMDGDSPDLTAMVELCQSFNAHLIVDEAHSVGVNGLGLLQELNLEESVFARLVTFGKALGCHGAVILGSSELKQYLVNFARSLIYTTALPPHSVSTIIAAYEELVAYKDATESIAYLQQLRRNIKIFDDTVKEYNLHDRFIRSNSAIKSMVVSGNTRVKSLSKELKGKGFDVKPILSPTVPEGEERLRFCVHSFNTEQEIKNVLFEVSKFVE